MPAADNVDARLEFLEDRVSEWDTLTRVRAKGIPALVNRAREIDAGTREFWTLKECVGQLMWEAVSPGLSRVLEHVKTEWDVGFFKDGISGVYPIGGKWGETHIFDVRLKCGLQALRINHLIRSTVAPKMKEAGGDPNGPQLWVPRSQGEMRRKRARSEAAGLSSTNGGGKGGGRGRGSGNGRGQGGGRERGRRSQRKTTKRQRQRRSQCGKWLADYTKAVPLLNEIAERADLSSQDLCEADFLDVSRRSCFRPRRFRFVDTSEIKELIRTRKSSTNPAEKRELGREIVQKRAEAKKSWRTDLLDRAAAGDFQVISYFRRKQSISASQLEYCLRVGGTGPAVGGLQAFYRQKYAPEEPAKLTSPMHLYDTAVGCRMPGPSLITREEVEHVLTLTKSGKSCGNDAAPYEFWSAALQSEACEHLLELLNDILLENVEMPANWMSSQVVLLPKTKEPREPKEYRPIVLAATLSKLFTKVLLLRLRSVFPHMASGQLSSQVGAQALDGSVALKHLIHLSRQWGLPLLACKLDIQAAFDTLSHESVARFLSSLGAHQEARLLLRLITQAEVSLSFANVTWRQRLKRGVLQGSAYSAELFARTLDYYLTPLLEEWARTEVTWVRSSDGTPLFAIIFADDILLLATNTAQLARMLGSLQDCLQAIGLHLARAKCQLIRSPDLPPERVPPRGFPEPIKEVDSFVFLGILVGFAVTCQMTLAARLRMATNSFFGYLGFLARAKGPLTKRLHLLDSFVTSRWRWLSAAVRPLFAVAKQLRTLQTHFLVSMTRLAHDPLQTSCENWVARRRGAKMAAQACGHRIDHGMPSISGPS
ncbi:unnamed protein product [Symbiodinium sp. CCMP2592]|nr:unnamed protein product [Symbiodinium sp. CCMP2592]